jgi:integrase
MPTFKAKILENKVNVSGKTNIKIRVNHKGSSRDIATQYYIEPRFFDNKAGRVKNTFPLAGDINIELAALELTYSRKVMKMEARIKNVSINDLVLYLKDTDNQGALDFFAVARNRVLFLEKTEKDSSAKILTQTINRVRDYNGGDKLPFVAINTQWLKGFDAWYCAAGAQNSAAIHLRNIRTLFNLALDDYGLSPEYYPFRKFKIKTQATIHRDLEPAEVARLMAFQPVGRFQETAKDLWLLSFFLVGINFKDLLIQRKEALKKGRLIYNRAKTGTIFSVKVEPEALAIINKYPGKKLLLNVLENKLLVQEKKERLTPLYKDVTDRTNKALKKIALAINAQGDEELIDPEISTYYARHSWGTIASKLGTPHDVIREALGHGRTVTDVYINFYTGKVDQANRQIIDAVLQYTKEKPRL